MGDEVLVTYRQKNKSERYYALPSEEKKNIDDVVGMFMKELTTVKGSNLFNRDYGTTFMEDISGQVNLYKVEWYLSHKYQDTYAKYGVDKVETSSVEKTSLDGFLEIRIKIYFEDFAVDRFESFLYNGVFTTETIIEMD